MSKYCFGVDIGGTTIKMGLFSDDYQLLSKWEIPTDKSNNGSNILTDVAKAIDEKLSAESISKEDILGVGIGVPGPVNKDNVVLKCVNLGWGVFKVGEEASRVIGIDNIKVGNDANVAALGEATKAGNSGYDDMVMLTLGTGVGGGVILGDKILSGTNGAAGELGHIQVRFDEKDSCGCGKCGCLEQYASATGIVKEAKRYMASHDDETVLRDIENLTAKDIFDHAKEGDTVSLKLVDRLGMYLGTACSHIASVVDPEAFVRGGGVSKAGNILIENIVKYYEMYAMEPLRGKPFELAKLGNDAGIYGCAKMILG